MSFMYEGVDADKPVPGFTGVPAVVVRAVNIVSIANERIKYYNSIAASYKTAYDALAKFKAANPNQLAANYDFASFSKLRSEKDNWTNIVAKNGGRFKSSGSSGGYIGDSGEEEADFSLTINKLNNDINKYQSTVKNYNSLSGARALPSSDQVMSSIAKDAKEASQAAYEASVKEARQMLDYEDKLKNLTDPNASRDYATPGNTAAVINTGLALGYPWTLKTLGLAASAVPGGNRLSDRDLSALLSSFPTKGKPPSLEDVNKYLRATIAEVGGRFIPKPASKNNAALKPSAAVVASTNPARPKTVAPISNNVRNLTNPKR